METSHFISVCKRALKLVFVWSPFFFQNRYSGSKPPNNPLMHRRLKTFFNVNCALVLYCTVRESTRNIPIYLYEPF